MTHQVSFLRRIENRIRRCSVIPILLSPGQHLQVRVFDENVGTRDEISIHIQIIFDNALVQCTVK